MNTEAMRRTAGMLAVCGAAVSALGQQEDAATRLGIRQPTRIPFVQDSSRGSLGHPIVSLDGDGRESGGNRPAAGGADAAAHGGGARERGVCQF